MSIAGRITPKVASLRGCSTFSSIQTGGLVYKKPPAKTAISP